MQNIDSTEKVKPGEQVLTAGIELAGGIRSPYPKGLLIGEVTDVRQDAELGRPDRLPPADDRPRQGRVRPRHPRLRRAACPAPDDTPIDCSLTGPDGALPGGEQPCIEPSTCSGAPSPLLP